ncbi:ABC transporter substrate-binding protein [Sedimentibacter sp.]|uniref:ABC transporter substrate-binding protein n=1 Tax=Sedimentibacter sp. TaxID=1960295 RepID=UPI0028AEF192|nr:ABC transporter substrate-binding protein [Sedimentibacter sp.]
MKKLMSLILVMVLLLSTVAGCSSTTGNTAEPPKETTPAGTGETAGKTELSIAIDSDISTMHPTDHSTTNEMDITNQIYDPLMKVSLDGSSEPEHRIAERYEISDDGLSYTFYLRKDATFHDGTPVTAEDVKFTAELYADSVYQSAKVEGMEKVEVIDENTVVFTTATAYSPFLKNIVDMHIASKAYYESASAEDFANKPVGSGPYKYVSHDLGSKIVLEAYEGYYLGEAEIINVTFKILSDDTTAAVALQTGEIDFASISESNYGNLEGKSNIVIEEVPMSRFGFISMNHEKYPFSEVKFRQAVAYAIDRQNIIDLALDGFGSVNSNVLSPLRFGYSEDQPQYDFNTEKTKELLAEIGIETPYDLGIMYVAESYKTQAEIIQNDLANVGLNVTLEILEFNAYLDKLMNGDCGITVLAMSLEGPTQEFSLAFKSDYIGAANNVRYSNKEMDDLFDKAVQAIDEDERFDIYNEIFTKAQRDAVYVALYNTVGLYAHNKDLKCHEFALEGRYYLYEFSWK